MDKKLLGKAISYLQKTDTVMDRLIRQCQPIAPSKTNPPHYHSLVSAIVNQQLSVKAGRTIEKRLLTKQGGRYFNAETILKLTSTAIRECGLSNNKVRYIRTLAQAVKNGELNFRKLSKQNDNDVRQTLTQFPGIGPWSADMFLIMSLRRADVFPVGDLVIRQSMQQHYSIPGDSKFDQYITAAESWRPYRTIASLYLWKSSSSG